MVALPTASTRVTFAGPVPSPVTEVPVAVVPSANLQTAEATLDHTSWAVTA